jgi:hypothetical protein
MSRDEFKLKIYKLPISLIKKERIDHLESLGDFTSIRLILDDIIYEIELTIDRLSNKQLIVTVLNEQKEVCNSMMDYIINMIEISYAMKNEDEEKNVRRIINSSS